MISTKRKILQMLLLIMRKLVNLTPQNSLITPTKQQCILNKRIINKQLKSVIKLFRLLKKDTTTSLSYLRQWAEKQMLYYN